MLKYSNSNTALYCTEMDFFPMYNAFMSDNPNCKLRQNEGYIKSKDVAGAGKRLHPFYWYDGSQWRRVQTTNNAVTTELSNASNMLAVGPVIGRVATF